MPFRHLLFNRRNGAPQRNPNQEPISLDQAAFFSLDEEFSRYNGGGNWNEQVPPPSASYNSMMQQTQIPKDHRPALNEPLDHTTMFPYNSMNSGVPYQSAPYDFDSHSLVYSSDVMDTDGSSISRGSIHSSISSASHLDVMLDEDLDSLHSLSRKASVISSFGVNSQSEQLCPLITGQVGKCSPELCGPSAPCLQYVNDEVVPPIEECVPDDTMSSSLTDAGNQPIDFTTPHTSPQRRRQQHIDIPKSTTVTPSDALQSTAADHEPRPRSRPRRPVTKASSATSDMTDANSSRQTKKSRARQAHSLVERKYRENLNAKIQELHQTLQRVQSSRSVSRTSSLSIRDEDDDIDDDELERNSAKVKKSDVLVEAMAYVHATEIELRRKDDEIERLNDRIKMMDGWMQRVNHGA